MAKINQPGSDPSLIGKNASTQPTDGRDNTSDELKFCTGDVDVIGVHLGYAIGTYSNKDGSGGLFITDGSSSFWIDENRSIHIQTGKTAVDGGTGGGLIMRSDTVYQKTGSYKLEVQGNDDEANASSDGKGEENNPAYSVHVYGNAAITANGDLSLAADNILIDAKEQLKLKSGGQTQITSGDGGGKVDVVTNEFKVTSKFAKYDLTGSFYIDGPEEITFNQKIKVDPIASNSISINTIGSKVSTNSIGGKNNILLGNSTESTLGNVQVSAYKWLNESISGTASLNLGPMIDFGLSTYQGTFIGTPRENSRSLSAYELYTGGTIGTSFNLLGNDISLTSIGTITGTTLSITDFIATAILLN
jgi:hypothetical protein